MSQRSKPIADVSEGSWTPIPLYPQINKDPQVDGAFITTSAMNDLCEVKLDALAWPQRTSQSGSQSLIVYLRNTGVPNTAVNVILMQGTNKIANQPFTLPLSATFSPYVLVLSAAQIALITDYTDLRARFGPVVLP